MISTPKTLDRNKEITDTNLTKNSILTSQHKDVSVQEGEEKYHVTPEYFNLSLTHTCLSPKQTPMCSVKEGFVLLYKNLIKLSLCKFNAYY